jgi:hypothetical protein
MINVVFRSTGDWGILVDELSGGHSKRENIGRSWSDSPILRAKQRSIHQDPKIVCALTGVAENIQNSQLFLNFPVL